MPEKAVKAVVLTRVSQTCTVTKKQIYGSYCAPKELGEKFRKDMLRDLFAKLEKYVVFGASRQKDDEWELTASILICDEKLVTIANGGD